MLAIRSHPPVLGLCLSFKMIRATVPLKQKTFIKERRPEAIKRAKSNPAEKNFLRYLEEDDSSSLLFPAPLFVSFLFSKEGGRNIKGQEKTVMPI